MKWRLNGPHYLRVKFKHPRDKQEVEYDVLFEATPETPIEIGKGLRVHTTAGSIEYIYEGPPTPEMEPLDEEAEVAMEVYKEAQARRLAVVNPIDALPMNYVPVPTTPVQDATPSLRG